MTSQVVINDVEPRTQAVAFSGQVTFNTNWTADASTDVVVYRRHSDEDADDQTQMVSQDDYTVEFVGTYETVRITFLVACDEGDIVTITRATPSDRENLYTNTNFTPSMLNQDFGILTMVDQQNQMYDQDFCPHYNLSCTYTDTADTAIDLILPILGPDQFWAKNGDNTRIVAADITTSGGGAPLTGPYVTYKASGLTNAFDLGTLSSGLLGINVSGAIATPYSTLAPTLNSITFNTTSGIIGTTTNNSAAAGSVGQYESAAVIASSAVTLTSTIAYDLCTLTLTAGDWDVWGNLFFRPNDTTMTSAFGWISNIATTYPDDSGAAGIGCGSGTISISGYGFNVPGFRVTLSTTTTIYLTGAATFGGSCTLCGAIYARRRR